MAYGRLVFRVLTKTESRKVFEALNYITVYLIVLIVSYQIRLYDKDDHMTNKLCYADTDPRMKTFDGKAWTASLAGEFVMYRDTRRKITVIT